MTKNKTLATAALAALFSLGLSGAALAQATPPTNAQKGQTMKDDKTSKEKAAKESKAQGKKMGAENGKKTGAEKKKGS